MNLVKAVAAVCVVIFFTGLMIPNKFEIKINHHHDFNNSISMRHHFDFGDKLHIELGNRATVPLKVDINHKENK